MSSKYTAVPQNIAHPRSQCHSLPGKFQVLEEEEKKTRFWNYYSRTSINSEFTSNGQSEMVSCFFATAWQKLPFPDQHTARRTEHVVTLYQDMFSAMPEQFPKHLAMCYVPITALATCWTASTAHFMSNAVHNMSYLCSVYAWNIKISMHCVLVGLSTVVVAQQILASLGAHSLLVATLAVVSHGVQHSGCYKFFISLICHLHSVSVPRQLLE